MPIRYRPPASPARYATTVSVFTRDGGRPTSVANQSLSAPTSAEGVSMADLGIHFDAGAFWFAGHRYSSFAEATADARRARADATGTETITWSLT